MSVVKQKVSRDWNFSISPLFFSRKALFNFLFSCLLLKPSNSYPVARLTNPFMPSFSKAPIANPSFTIARIASSSRILNLSFGKEFFGLLRAKSIFGFRDTFFLCTHSKWRLSPEVEDPLQDNSLPQILHFAVVSFILAKNFHTGDLSSA